MMMIRMRGNISLLVVTLLLFATTALADAEVKDRDKKGVPTFVTGSVGKLTRNDAAAAKEFLKAQKDLLKMTGTEDFEVLASIPDEKLKQSHFKLRESLRGLPVIGAEYIVHADASGNVFAVNGRFVADKDLPKKASVEASTALQTALTQLGITAPQFVQPAELVYVVTDQSDAYLAWRSTVAYRDKQGPQLDIIYADATNGNLVLRDPQYKRIKYRFTYSADNTWNLPGRLVLTEGSPPSGDVPVDAAHDHVGVAYDYYIFVHGRNSWDDAGANLVSTAHYGESYNNAYWNGNQVVYGDGDGFLFAPLSQALDICTHEWTHAVTSRTANLAYSYESGALNEATSDILGSSAEAWIRGVSANTWKIGEDAFTPFTDGDALRFMNDPAAAGDRDFYPDRFTGSEDSGGVHTNSGIANLAFYLMVAGGTHPRGKTSNYVSAFSGDITYSLQVGERVWYRALRYYMNSSTNFVGARNATAQAARDIYGMGAGDTVNSAWDAVGVPGSVSASNPFTYVRGRDQFLSCWGIAGRIVSNCNDVSDPNDRQMCRGLSSRSQSPCTSMTDRNMQLACYGMSTQQYPSNCRDITDPDMRNFCYGVSGRNLSYCNYVTEDPTKQLCYAMASGNNAYCNNISDPNDRNFCLGVSSLQNGYCANIQQ
jgi:Zn-dependent metalloprotease